MTSRATSSGMPQISAAFAGWMTNISLLKHTESVVNGFVKSTQNTILFYGTIQPLSPRSLALKPEGQRSWTWLQIHARALSLNLIPGDKITWSGDIYKVMELLDYSLNGFVEYHLVKDFQNQCCP